jgi:hypothetical protein
MGRVANSALIGRRQARWLAPNVVKDPFELETDENGTTCFCIYMVGVICPVVRLCLLLLMSMGI